MCPDIYLEETPVVLFSEATTSGAANTESSQFGWSLPGSSTGMKYSSFNSLFFYGLVDGNYSLWTDWSTPCDANYQQMRTRECKDAVNGGQCYGDDKEIRKCGENSFHEENVTCLEQREILR